MRRRSIAVIVAFAVWLSVAETARAADPGESASAPQGALTSGGTFYVTWESDPDPIPLNEVFTIRFKVQRADDRGSLVPHAFVTASAWMPKHNHGTTLQPRVESHGDGTATGEGFLLHMQGLWELRVGVAVDGQMERAIFGLLIEP